MSRIALSVGAFLGVTAFVIYPEDPSRRIDPGNLACTMKFGLSTWTQANKPSEGSGVVSCESGATLAVRIVATGSRLHETTSTVAGAAGTFSRLHSVAEVFGSFTRADYGPAADEHTQVLRKGRVTLTLCGGNERCELGTGLSEFVLTRAP